MAQTPEIVGEIAISKAAQVSQILNYKLSNLSEADKKGLIGDTRAIGQFKRALKQKIIKDVYGGTPPLYIYNIFKGAKQSRSRSDVILFNSLFKTIGNNLKTSKKLDELQEDAEVIYKTFDVLKIDPVDIGNQFIKKIGPQQEEPQKEPQGLESKEEQPEAESEEAVLVSQEELEELVDPDVVTVPFGEPDPQLVTQQQELFRGRQSLPTRSKDLLRGKPLKGPRGRIQKILKGKKPEDFGPLPSTLSQFRRKVISYLAETEYLGSGTPLIDFIRTGVRPTNDLDLISMEHDIHYTTALTPEDVNKADSLFIERLNDLYRNDPLKTSMVGVIAGGLMTFKTAVDRLPFSRTESIYVNFEENKNRNPEINNILKEIQNELQTLDKLTNENTAFIFDESAYESIQSAMVLKRASELLKEDDEESLSDLFGEEEDDEVDEEYRELMSEVEEGLREGEAEKNLKKTVEFLKKELDKFSETDRLQYLRQLAEEDPELLEAYFASISEDSPTQTPAPSPRGGTHPSFKGGYERRKGERQRLEDEQRLQRLQQEEHDRKMGMIYENDNDDYMANPVPNSYMRPMFATQWLDIEKLRQYQTPEYVKAEKEIWSRNWQTPFQFGAGTENNAIKDIQNLAERMARMEHYLRFELATKGLPKDQRNVAVNFGEPMRRTGRVQKSHHERYDIYKKMNKDMSRFQYNQRVNEPPRTKLFNRDINYKPTELKPSQQRLYDEKLNEGLPKLDIKNDFDEAYYMRRIRKPR